MSHDAHRRTSEPDQESEVDGPGEGPLQCTLRELLPRDLLSGLLSDLRQLAAARLANERPGHTLQPTALVHELWLRIAGREDVRFDSKEAFLAYAAEAIRHILVDHARRRNAVRRGGGRGRVDVAALDELPMATGPRGDRWAVALLELEQELDLLKSRHPRSAQVFELRYFGGLSNERVATHLGVSTKTVQADWAAACGWLGRRLGAWLEGPPPHPSGGTGA